MSSQSFYLVGDEPLTAKAILISEKDDLKSLKKTLAEIFHIAGKQGVLSFTSSQTKAE
jgi:hypothetical protein